MIGPLISLAGLVVAAAGFAIEYHHKDSDGTPRVVREADRIRIRIVSPLGRGIFGAAAVLLLLGLGVDVYESGSLLRALLFAGLGGGVVATRLLGRRKR